MNAEKRAIREDRIIVARAIVDYLLYDEYSDLPARITESEALEYFCVKIEKEASRTRKARNSKRTVYHIKELDSCSYFQAQAFLDALGHEKICGSWYSDSLATKISEMKNKIKFLQDLSDAKKNNWENN